MISLSQQNDHLDCRYDYNTFKMHEDNVFEDWTDKLEEVMPKGDYDRFTNPSGFVVVGLNEVDKHGFQQRRGFSIAY